MGLKKKRAQMLGVVSALAVASLVSVGFAGWVISNTQEEDDAASISADYEIVDQSIGKLTVSGTPDKTICFGAPATGSQSSYSDKWLSNSPAVADQEDLEAELKRS